MEEKVVPKKTEEPGALNRPDWPAFRPVKMARFLTGRYNFPRSLLSAFPDAAKSAFRSCSKTVLSLLFALAVFFIVARPFCAAFELGASNGETGWFGLANLSGALDFRYYDDTEKDLGTAGGSQFQSNNQYFEERLDLSTAAGYIYHPNFLQFSGNTSFGLRQDIYSFGQESGSGNHFIYDYDINGSILVNKPINLTFFANKSETLASTQFFDLMTIDTSSYGGSLNYRNSVVPMTLSFRQQDLSETAIDYRSNRQDTTLDYWATNKIGDILTSDFRYEYRDVVEQIPTTQETTFNSLNLNQSLNYSFLHGASSIMALSTSGLTSASDTDTLQINENFHTNLAKNFNTIYGYTFSYFDSFPNYQSDTNAGYLGFNYKLFDSLYTEIKGDFSQNDATDYQQSYYDGRFLVNYNKAVPGGEFMASYNFLYRHTDIEAPAGNVNVVGEQIVLSDSQRTFLANSGVVLSSVVVTDTSYIPLINGVNYRLIPNGFLIEIQRVDLPNNTTVLVNYSYESPGNLTYDSFGNQVDLRYDFRNWFSLHYGYQNLTNHDDSTGIENPATERILAETMRTVYEANARWRWFEFSGGYEKDNSNLTPSDGWRVRGTFNISPTDTSHFTLSAVQSLTNFSAVNSALIQVKPSEISYGGFEANYTMHINYYLDASLKAGYLKETGTDLEDSIWRFGGVIKARYRALEFYLQPEYLKRHELTDERDVLLIKFNMVRRFDIF